jgi:transposase
MHMDVTNDSASFAQPRRIEVLNGPERRRSWSDTAKIAIVAEALAPGVVVSEVARRHDLNPSQLFGWIRQFRAEVEAMSAGGASSNRPMFVPAIVEAAKQPLEPDCEAPVPASIEIRVGAARVQIEGAADAKTVSAVIKALKVFA